MRMIAFRRCLAAVAAVLAAGQAAAQAPDLASSVNIGAFNLGNALGAWLGGVVISQGPGLSALPWVAALVPASAFAVALWALALERRQRFALAADCA